MSFPRSFIDLFVVKESSSHTSYVNFQEVNKQHIETAFVWILISGSNVIDISPDPTEISIKMNFDAIPGQILDVWKSDRQIIPADEWDDIQHANSWSNPSILNSDVGPGQFWEFWI